MEVWVGAGVELGEGEEDRSFRVKLDSMLSRPPCHLPRHLCHTRQRYLLLKGNPVPIA